MKDFLKIILYLAIGILISKIMKHYNPNVDQLLLGVTIVLWPTVLIMSIFAAFYILIMQIGGLV
jgi:hypothetical protein